MATAARSAAAGSRGALFQMKDGQVGPLIELTNGFHVIKLVHRDHAGQQPFDEKTQTRIREKLRGRNLPA